MLLQDHFEAVLEHSNPSVAEGDLEEFVEFTVSSCRSSNNATPSACKVAGVALSK